MARATCAGVAKKFETKRGRELLKRNQEIDKPEVAELAEAITAEDDAKIAVRNLRRDANEHARKLAKQA